MATAKIILIKENYKEGGTASGTEKIWNFYSFLTNSQPTQENATLDSTSLSYWILNAQYFNLIDLNLKV